MLATAGACLASSDEESSETSALDTSNPGARIGSPFSTPMYWHWTDLGSDGDPTRCHDCSTTPATSPETASARTTLSNYVALLGPSWTGAPTEGTFAAAATEGDAVLTAAASDNVTAALAGVKSDFDAIIDATGGTGSATLHDPVKTTWVVAFPRTQARQLELEYKKDDGRFDQIHSYTAATPTLSELRMRGAKSFCAARSAAFEMDARKATAGYAFYDHSKSDFLWWHTGVTGASLRMLPSTKHLDHGSEAFAVPFQLSSRLAPISGPMMPSFGELAHPLVWLTADREIRSFEDWGNIHIGTCRTGLPFCIEGNLPTYRKVARNLEHDDALAGTAFSQRLTLDEIQIVNWGWFSLKAHADVTVETGLLNDHPLISPEGFVELFGPFVALASRLPVLDDLLSPEPSYAADAPLALNGPFVAFGGHSSIHDAPTTPASITRWRNNDDRAVTITDRISEGVGLSANVGFDVGPVNITVTGISSITNTSQQDIAVREQLSLVDQAQMLPPLLGTGTLAQTNVVVVPHSTSTFVFHPLTVSLEFKVSIPTPLGSIDLDWHQPFFTLTDIPIADPDPYGGDEHQRIRIGEYSDAPGFGGFDGISQRPKTVSYLVGRQVFEAFPQPVSACLADPRPVPPPDQIPARPTMGGPIQSHTCAIGPGNYDLNIGAPLLADTICSDPAVRDDFARQASDTFTGNSLDPSVLAIQKPLEVQCMKHVIDFVCRPTSLKVSPTSRSHVTTADEKVTYGNIVTECTTAFVYGVSDPDIEVAKAKAKALGNLVGEKLLVLRPCGDDGTPYDGSDVHP